ncbi:MAG: hypothetical protein C0617_15475 [Desulfuromonas sp.]|uniref:hypothetical protein n=1 Tax=Desulfuromonas sp. TaxID=892 RepID=UPI000CB45B69|nr:hypothetical protein [Desulfuromonas sp.]PLX81923.1 MAG: hypothetical protein C0617_15475 [Desulfuromonas sp.]
MAQLLEVLNRALEDQRISQQDWKTVLELATEKREVVVNGENASLSQLVSLLEGGGILVDGVPQDEILRNLAVFA